MNITFNEMRIKNLMFAISITLAALMFLLPDAGWSQGAKPVQSQGALNRIGASYRPILMQDTHALNMPPLVKRDLELSKINHIFNKYKSADIQVFADGMTRSTWMFSLWARGFLNRTYHKGDDAALWIKHHTYRSIKGNIIYFKYPNGELRPMRDVFLEDLAVLNSNRSSEPTSISMR